MASADETIVSGQRRQRISGHDLMNLQSLAPRLFAAHGDVESLPQRFWKWWSGEILYFVPPAVREIFDSQDQVLLVSVNEKDMQVELMHGSERRQLERISLDSEGGATMSATRSAYPDTDAVVVELSAAQVFHREVSVPFGTEDRIADVLGFEMDRLTPFAKDDVYFHHRVTGRDQDRKVINIHLVIALRTVVDDILARLKSRGIMPSKITLHGGAESSDRALASVNLLPRASRVRAPSKRNLLPTVLSALAALLLIIAIAYPLVQQKFRLNSLDEEISRLGPAAIAAEKTQDEIADAVRLSGFFADKWARMPTKIRLLNELTRIVPDDTWLARVQILGTTIRVHGESEGASSLIGLIEASEIFSDARFSSPVTKNPRTSNDRFVIEAQIKTDGGDE
jgi:general secretion pathway protein L